MNVIKNRNLKKKGEKMKVFVDKQRVLDLMDEFCVTDGLYNAVKNLDAENVVGVVRCFQCARWDPDGSYQNTDDGFVKMCGACEITHHYFPEDHFCRSGIYRPNAQKSAAPEAPGAAGAESSN